MRKVKYEVAGISDAGIQKEVNEDSLIYKVADMGNMFAGIFAIADGVGNLQRGELASSITVTEISEWWDREFLKHSEDEEYLKGELYHAIESANDRLVQLEVTDNLKTASTLSVLFLYDNNWTLYNVGDSRIYKHRHGMFGSKFRMLTKDHSCEIEKNINGSIVKKNVLTEYIGKKTHLSILKSEGRTKPGEVYIVCSDGIYKTMKEEEIHQIVDENRKDAVMICRELVDKVKSNMETDNISIIAIKINR